FLEMAEALVAFGFWRSSLLLVSHAVRAALGHRIFEAFNLFLDRRLHLDAETLALEHGFERGNRGSVATPTERVDGRAADGEMRILQIPGNRLREFVIFFLQTSQSGDRSLAGFRVSARSGPFAEQRNGAIVAEGAEAA